MPQKTQKKIYSVLTHRPHTRWLLPSQLLYHPTPPLLTSAPETIHKTSYINFVMRPGRVLLLSKRTTSHPLSHRQQPRVDAKHNFPLNLSSSNSNIILRRVHVPCFTPSRGRELDLYEAQQFRKSAVKIHLHNELIVPLTFFLYYSKIP